jgi:hypothetical protein
MSKVTGLLEAKLNLSPEKMSIDEVMELAKQKRIEMGHDCLLVVTFKENPPPDGSYNVSVYGLEDDKVFSTLHDLSALFYEMK